MANSNFVVHNGLTVGPLVIDAATGSITTPGDVSITGNLGVSQISKNDSSVSINDTGTGSTVVIKIDGATEQTVDANGVNLATGGYYSINGSSVLNATTLGSAVVNSSLTSVGTITSLAATTAVATNLSTGNAVITGGSLNNTTVGATTHNTGRFTTVTATTVNAGTIGNSGATLTGTLSTASQTNITAVGTISTGTWSASFGAVSGANLTNLTATNINGTVATANVSLFETVASTSTNATFYPYLSDKTDGNTAGFIASSFNINPSTGLVRTASLTSSGTIIASTVNAGTIGNSGATLTGTLSTAAQTNVTSVGTLTGLTVSGAIVPNANLTINVGSVSAWFNTFYGVSTQAKYADLAENYQADRAYNPGTVLMFGGTQEVTVADAGTPAVAGVVSTNPAHLMNGQLAGANVVALALTGRVPCMVIGPVKKGDMMISAGFGYARSSANPAIGQVIGKALQDFPLESKGIIEVVVGRV
jgi:hypothetical protein